MASRAAGTFARPEAPVEERVVVDSTLGPVRKNSGGNARQAPHRSVARPTDVLLPGGDQGRAAEDVQVGVRQHGHPAIS
jgi:hypothetical protein